MHPCGFLKTIETIETIFNLLVKLSIKKKTQEKNKSQEKTNQRIVSIVSIVFKKKQGAELRSISIVFKKNARSRVKKHLFVF